MINGCVVVPSVHGSTCYLHCLSSLPARLGTAKHGDPETMSPKIDSSIAVKSAFISHPGLTKQARPARRLRSHRLCARLLPADVKNSRSTQAEASRHAKPPPAARWRRAAAIAATIAAGVLLPGRVHSNRAAAADTSRIESIELSTDAVVSKVRSSRRQAVHVNVSNTRESYSSARSSQLTFVDSVSAIRGKAVEVKDSLLNALKDESEDGHSSHQAAVNDALVLLLTTVVIVPLMRRLNTSPILGFLAAGIALGPNGFGLIRDVASSKALAELGVVFFLFEMGLELSTSKLKSLGADVFGLGTAQFLVTGALISIAASLAKVPTNTAIVIGAGLALSSSAFVLQLLSERGEVGTRFGRAGFGILLFQDLAVVPVLVLTPLLASSGGASAVLSAISVASIKATLALAFIFLMGKNFLQPVFRFVARAKSPEAFIAVILLTVLGTSSLTQVLGLSDTLGAFLAGVMLAETKYRHQVEADIKPFRGLLLGLFFITVGFSIDLKLAMANAGTVATLVTGLLAVKTAVIGAAGVAIGMSVGSALRTGLLLSQGGEFAFVIFALAQGVGVLSTDLSQLLLLVVAISMALTPMLADLGQRIAASMESKRGLIGMRMEDADTADARDFVMVAGWGRVGQSVCEMLDAKLVRYMAFDMSPTRVIDARNKGLPVYFGDACRPEVLRSAGVARARAIVVTLDDPKAALQAVQNIRREFPDIRVFCRARDPKHQRLLQAAGATAIVPELLEASLLLGGAVLLNYGTPIHEVNSLIEEKRMETWNDLSIDDNNSATLRSQFRNLQDVEVEKEVKEETDVSRTGGNEEEEVKVAVAEASETNASTNGVFGSDDRLGSESSLIKSSSTDGNGKLASEGGDDEEEYDPEDIYAPISPVVSSGSGSGGISDASPSSDNDSISSGMGSVDKRKPDSDGV